MSQTAEGLTDEEWQDIRDQGRQDMPDALTKATSLPEVLLSYQQKLLATTAIHNFVVCEKSRRIGMTWAVGADAVLTAGAGRKAGGMDVMYIGYNQEMAREFIDTCGMWAKAFIPAASSVKEFLFKDQSESGEEKDILAFRINFASGFEIIALTSKPRSLRGRQGYLIFDEAAFHDELEEMLKAAMAFLIWGGKVLVISTHDGQDNPFNELINDIRAKKRPGAIIRVTFDEAIADGLYRRIALVTGQPDTPEEQGKWVASIRANYGADASEELDCIAKAGSGAYLSGATIEACMSDAHVVATLDCPDGFELRPMPKRTEFVQSFLEDHVGPSLKRLDPKRLSAIGEDFGRSVDLSVIAVGVEESDLSITVPIMVEMRNTPIEQQKQVVRYTVGYLKRFLGGKFDATGNGLALAEWAQEEYGFGVIDAVKLSQSWYLENGPLLKGHIDDQTIQLPRDSSIKDDLRAVRLVNGIPSIPSDRKAGRHGDGAVALMMLIAALKSTYQEAAYRPVPEGGGKDMRRAVKITAGFRSRKGVW